MIEFGLLNSTEVLLIGLSITEVTFVLIPRRTLHTRKAELYRCSSTKTRHAARLARLFSSFIASGDPSSLSSYAT